MTRTTWRTSEAGFSIIDTLITVSVGVILTAIAVPTMLSSVGTMGIQSDARLVEQALQNARLSDLAVRAWSAGRSAPASRQEQHLRE